MSNYLQNRHARQNYGLYNPFFDDFFKEDNSFSTMMKTDIKENNDHYEMKIELPEVKKEDVKLSLDDGYLTVNAVFKNDNDEKEGKFIRRERSYGSFSRSYYVGDNIENWEMDYFTDVAGEAMNDLYIAYSSKYDISENSSRVYSIPERKR